MLEKYLQIHPEIQKSISAGEPVVALGSDIISHGIPYPKNIKMANDICKIIRNCGAIPATTAIIDGILRVGLTEEEIELLALNKDILKASRKDLPFIISKKLTGYTTVATTMILANLAGIKVLATSSIGGVYRNVQETFDISADLQELSSTNVAVVCSGIKTVLDIGLTLEYLETKGVPVIGYRTNEMPAFYARKSGFDVDYKVDSSLEISKTLKVKWDLNLKGGVVIANPIISKSEMDYKAINTSIDTALKEAESKKIKGKDLIPFLLHKINPLTEGEVLNANIQLILDNAKLAADIAKNLSNLYKTKL